MEEREQYGTCTWCNNKNTVITCAGCGKGVRYGDTCPSHTLKANNQPLRVCVECGKKEEECEK